MGEWDFVHVYMFDNVCVCVRACLHACCVFLFRKLSASGLTLIDVTEEVNTFVEIDLLRAKSQGWSPQIKLEPTPVKNEPESGELLHIHTRVGTSPVH